jgi:N-acetylneuraminate synthase/sialic acid synthase
MSRALSIAGTTVHDDSDCYVIAEVGCNHQGSIERAKEMFSRAKLECGVNAVKLQKRDNRELYTRAMYDLPYINENSFGDTYGRHREALELGADEYRELQSHAANLGLTMFATPFDFASADFLAELDMPAYKTASGDITNTPFLKYVAKLGKPMLVSTGGATMSDVERAYDAIMPINPQLCILQCTSSYPAEPEDLNLRAIVTYRDRFPDTVIGLSDHQNGIAMALVGYMLGARVIEKHFTINRGWKGTDQAFSLEPIGMRKLVRDLSRARVALGDGVKRPAPSENSPLVKMGKKLVAARDMPAGHDVTRDDIAIKSPGDGLPPYHLDEVVGLVTNRPLKMDEDISFGVLGPADRERRVG